MNQTILGLIDLLDMENKRHKDSKRDILMAMGRAVCHQRTIARMTQTELAKAAGVSKTAISLIEAGATGILSVENFRAIGEVLENETNSD